MISMYKRREYHEIDFGSCNICLGRRNGQILCFDFSSDDMMRIELAHQQCLDDLVDPEEWNLFVLKTREGVRKLNLRLQSRNN